MIELLHASLVLGSCFDNSDRASTAAVAVSNTVSCIQLSTALSSTSSGEGSLSFFAYALIRAVGITLALDLAIS